MAEQGDSQSPWERVRVRANRSLGLGQPSHRPSPKGRVKSSIPSVHLPVSPSDRIPLGQMLLVLAVPLLVMVAILNFAPMLPLLREELGLTNAWLGALATATILSHTVLQLPGGHLADKIGVKRAIELGLLVMAVSILASGLAPSLPFLLLCRFFLGVGTATAFISSLSCMNSLVPVTKRVVAQGWFGAAANAGVLLVLLLSDRMAHWEGWRGIFLIEGALILGVAWLFSSRFRPSSMVFQLIPVSWSDTLRAWPLYLLGIAHILGYGVFTAMATWMATFLWQEHGIGLEWAGPLAAFLPASAIAARTLGGSLSVGRERQMIIVCNFVTALSVGLLPFLPGSVLALVDLLILGWFANMPFGALFSYISRVAPKGASARGFSLVNFVGNCGALAFPPVVGYALDTTGSFGFGFGVVAAVALVGAGAVALWLPSGREA